MKGTIVEKLVEGHQRTEIVIRRIRIHAPRGQHRAGKLPVILAAYTVALGIEEAVSERGIALRTQIYLFDEV